MRHGISSPLVREGEVGLRTSQDNIRHPVTNQHFDPDLSASSVLDIL